jgi:hypothetical protein
MYYAVMYPTIANMGFSNSNLQPRSSTTTRAVVASSTKQINVIGPDRETTHRHKRYPYSDILLLEAQWTP